MATLAASPTRLLAKVARRIGELMECEVPLISDWLDESTITDPMTAARQISRKLAGQHRYFWKTRAATRSNACSGKSGRRTCPNSPAHCRDFANQFAEKIAHRVRQ